MADINIHVHSENDLLDSYSADRTVLNPSFVAFLQKQYEEKRGRGETNINIISDAPVDEACVRGALKNYLETELVRNRNERRHNRVMEAYLFLLGVACIVAGILLTKLSAIYLQILSLTAGFAIKEAATIFFMKNPRNTVDRAILLFLGRSKVRFQIQGSAIDKPQ